MDITLKQKRFSLACSNNTKLGIFTLLIWNTIIGLLNIFLGKWMNIMDEKESYRNIIWLCNTIIYMYMKLFR